MKIAIHFLKKIQKSVTNRFASNVSVNVFCVVISITSPPPPKLHLIVRSRPQIDSDTP